MFKNIYGRLRMQDGFGYIYQNYAKLPDGSSYWRCEYSRKAGHASCKVRAKISNDILVSRTGQHNHIPDGNLEGLYPI